MKKVYNVILSNSSKCDEIHDFLISKTNNLNGIPNESVECVNRKSHSKLRTSYLLTDDEVNIIKQNPDVLTVELDKQYYPDDNIELCSKPTPSFKYPRKTYSWRPQNRFFMQREHRIGSDEYYMFEIPWQNKGSSSNLNLRQTYSKITPNVDIPNGLDEGSGFMRAFLEPKPIVGLDSNVVSWGKIRTNYKYNPWAGISSCIIRNDNVSSSRDGSDVDLVIQDNGIDKHHPEFLDENGNSRVRDIIIHGPAYVDASYFESNPSKTYVDWWENASNRSPINQSLGTITIPRYTMLTYFTQSNSYVSLSTFQANIGKKVIQTIDGVEYTRGTLVSVEEIVGSFWWSAKIQLDSGKPHFRYYHWSEQDTGNSSWGDELPPASTPCPITVDPEGSAIIQSPPLVAAGFIWDEESILTNNPNNSPVDSTGVHSISDTMNITEVNSGLKVSVTAGSNVATIVNVGTFDYMDYSVRGQINIIPNGLFPSGTKIVSANSSNNTITMNNNATGTRSDLVIKLSNGFKYGNRWLGGFPMYSSSNTIGSSGIYYNWEHGSTTTWTGRTLEYKNGLDGNTHGTHCASEAAGKNLGYASKCNIWSSKLYFGAFQVEGELGLDPETSFDTIKIFHQAKLSNPKYGNKNPTVMSGSWSYNRSPFAGIPDNTTCNYTYRGSSSSFNFRTNLPFDSTPDFLKTSLYKAKYTLPNLINNVAYEYEFGNPWPGNPITGIKLPISEAAVKTAGQECLNAGVHMCFSAGNSNAYVVKDPSDQDYNNTFTNPYTGLTTYVHHVGSPADISGSINVGALSCTTRPDGKERKDYYSCKGPGVDIYAPALHTISADSFKKELLNEYLLTGYPTVPSYNSPPWPTYVTMYVPSSEKKAIHNWFSGTSSATPNVAGVLVTFLQKNRTATTTDAKEWLLGTSSTYNGSSGSYIDKNIVNDTYSNFWGNWEEYTTTISITNNEQTFDLGDGESIVLDTNHHIAYTETADALLDTDIKILYNPYHNVIEYDSNYGFANGDGLTFSGVTINYT